MNRLTQMQEAAARAAESDGQNATGHVGSTGQTVRIKSQDLFQHQREVEIDHHGRIYRLRLTQLNKLILTA